MKSIKTLAKILGVDPGLRHSGWCVLNEDGSYGEHGVVIPPGHTKQPTDDYLRYILPSFRKIIKEHGPFQAAAIEQVVFQRHNRNITIPLSHVAGALVGLIWGKGIPVFLLTPNMKTFTIRKKEWSEHEKDAAVLATVVQRYLNALIANDTSTLRKLSAVARRNISVKKNVLGNIEAKNLSKAPDDEEKRPELATK